MNTERHTESFYARLSYRLPLWGQKSDFKCKDCSATFVDKEHFERHKKNIHKQ